MKLTFKGFRDFVENVELEGWSFKELESNDESKVFVTNERVRVPVGSTLVKIRLFISVTRRAGGTYRGVLGMVPDVESLSDELLVDIVKRAKSDSAEDILLLLIKSNGFHSVFLEEVVLERVMSDDFIEDMKKAVVPVSNYLDFFMNGGFKGGENVDVFNIGWSVLIRTSLDHKRSLSWMHSVFELGDK